MGIFNFFKKKDKLPEPPKPKQENSLKSLEEEHGLIQNNQDVKDSLIVEKEEIKVGGEEINLPKLEEINQQNILENTPEDNERKEEVEENKQEVKVEEEKESKEDVNTSFEEELEKYKELLESEKKKEVKSVLEVEEGKERKRLEGTLFVSLEVYEKLRMKTTTLFEEAKNVKEEMGMITKERDMETKVLKDLEKDLLDFEDKLLYIDSKIFNER